MGILNGSDLERIDEITGIAKDDMGHKLRPIKMFQESSFPLIAQSEPLEYSFDYAFVDNRYLYFYESTQGKIMSIDKDTLKVVAESSPIQAALYDFKQDDQYIYFAGGNRKQLVKMNKTDLTVVATSSVLSFYFNTFAIDDDYIYCSSGTNKAKLSKGNLSIVASQNSGVSIADASNSIATDKDYLYVRENATNALVKLNKVSFSEVARSVSRRDTKSFLVVDDTYIYASDVEGRSLATWSKTDMKLERTFSGDISTIICNGKYYFVSAKDNTTNSPYRVTMRYLVSDYAYYSTRYFGESISGSYVAVDDQFIYVYGPKTKTIMKFEQKLKNVYQISGYVKEETP